MLCNAGISEKYTGITEDSFDVVFETNHLGYILLTKRLLPYMETERPAHMDSSLIGDLIFL